MRTRVLSRADGIIRNMWVFTTFGFFSIVEHRDSKDKLLIRGRAKSDLQAFVSRIPKGRPKPKIYETPEADYRYRTTVDRRNVELVLAEATSQIDYDNFKNAVAEHQGRQREQTYHAVWSVLWRGMTGG